jgi:hypothetical protein
MQLQNVAVAVMVNAIARSHVSFLLHPVPIQQQADTARTAVEFSCGLEKRHTKVLTFGRMMDGLLPFIFLKRNISITIF